MISGILRQPMAILGALGLLSLAEDLLQWQQQFQTWIDAWQAFSRPVAMFLFGWLIDLWPWELPEWTLDYLIVGSIVYASFVRTILFVSIPNSLHEKHIPYLYIWCFTIFGAFIFLPLISIAWPISVIWYPIVLYSQKRQASSKAAQIFMESLIWAAILIAINYAWIASG
jgi:hypothetical protein